MRSRAKEPPNLSSMTGRSRSNSPTETATKLFFKAKRYSFFNGLLVDQI